MMAADTLVMWGEWAAAIGSIIVCVTLIWKNVIRPFVQAAEDVQQTVETVRKQLLPDGGDSLADQIVAIRHHLDEQDEVAEGERRYTHARIHDILGHIGVILGLAETPEEALRAYQEKHPADDLTEDWKTKRRITEARRRTEGK